MDDIDSVAVMKNKLLISEDNYMRLLESYKKVQEINNMLEDKLLNIVGVHQSDKEVLKNDISIINQKLLDAYSLIEELKKKCERYRNDCSLAVQLLQCRPSNFVSQQLHSLPSDVQEKIKKYWKIKESAPYKDKFEAKTITVPIPTFPPTATVYSVTQEASSEDAEETPSLNVVSAAIIAKVLQEREKEHNQKHCSTCTCSTTFQLSMEQNNSHSNLLEFDEPLVVDPSSSLLHEPNISLKVIR